MSTCKKIGGDGVLVTHGRPFVGVLVIRRYSAVG